MDPGERGTGDLRPAPGPRLLPATPRFFPGRHGDASTLPAYGGGVHRPQEPQVCHEAAVRDLRLEARAGDVSQLFGLDVLCWDPGLRDGGCVTCQEDGQAPCQTCFCQSNVEKERN